MEFKVVIADPKNGKCYQREVVGENANKIRNVVIGSELNGSVIGLKGYTLMITGGSDKQGFPMKKGIAGIKRPRILVNGGVGYRSSEEVKKRKRVRGERIDEDIIQINTKISKYGDVPIESLLGGEKPETDKKEEKKE